MFPNTSLRKEKETGKKSSLGREETVSLCVPEMLGFKLNSYPIPTLQKKGLRVRSLEISNPLKMERIHHLLMSCMNYSTCLLEATQESPHTPATWCPAS